MRAVPLPLARILTDRLGTPARWYQMAGRLMPWCAGAAVALTLLAMGLGLLAPVDAARGEAARIVFVHVPAAWTSLVLYFGMAAWAALALTCRARLPALMMSALAPAGILFTCVALWTGWLLGKASRYSGLVWDAQLACEMILFALYAAVLALRALIADADRADRASAALVLVGALNLPFIYYSLSWWQGLHDQAAAASPALAHSMLAGMLSLALAFCMYAKMVALARVRSLILETVAGPAGVGAQGAA